MARREHSIALSYAAKQRSAFTLIELLVVMAIISVMVSILLPTLTKAREQGRVTQCLSNTRQIGIGFSMYMQDNGEQVPWVNPHPNGNWVSPFAWGGFVAPAPSKAYGNSVDYVLHNAENRPLNLYVAPTAHGNEVIQSYVCPSDNYAPFENTRGGGGTGRWVSNFEWSRTTTSAWTGAGNSYAINWWWMNFYYPNGSWSIDQIKPLSYRLIKKNLGGQGSAFVIATEAPMHTFLADARGGAGGVQASGWHAAWSRHSMLFFDGHSEYRAVDTRYPFGDGWSIWPSPN